MELRNFLSIFSRRKWLILITIITTVLVVTAYTFLVKPVYEVSTTLRVASASIATPDFNQYLYAERILNTYAQLVYSIPVRDELMRKLSLIEPPAIAVRILPATELIQITVTNNDPVLAANIANGLNDILVDRNDIYYLGGRASAQDIINKQIAQVGDELQQAQMTYNALMAEPSSDVASNEAAKQVVDSKNRTYLSLLDQYEQYRIKEAITANVVSVVSPAVIPISPVRPQIALNIILGLLMGIIGGFGLALVSENLDNRLYTLQQIENTSGLCVLSEIPKAKKKNMFKAYIGDPPPGDEFRALRMNLFNNHKNAPIKTLLISSIERDEGKSTVLVNLAFVLAQSGKKVVVVDGNLRSPALHTMFDTKDTPGLSNILKQNASSNEVFKNSQIPGLIVVPGGPKDLYPAELLDSDSMKSLLRELRNQFDVVLVDSPAVLSEIDAILLAPYVDGVLLVLNSEHISRDLLQKAIKKLRNVQANLLGVVVNNTRRRSYWN